MSAALWFPKDCCCKGSSNVLILTKNYFNTLKYDFLGQELFVNQTYSKIGTLPCENFLAKKTGVKYTTSSNPPTFILTETWYNENNSSVLIGGSLPSNQKVFNSFTYGVFEQSRREDQAPPPPPCTCGYAYVDNTPGVYGGLNLIAFEFEYKETEIVTDLTGGGNNFSIEENFVFERPYEGCEYSSSPAVCYFSPLRYKIDIYFVCQQDDNNPEVEIYSKVTGPGFTTVLAESSLWGQFYPQSLKTSVSGQITLVFDGKPLATMPVYNLLLTNAQYQDNYQGSLYVSAAVSFNKVDCDPEE